MKNKLKKILIFLYCLPLAWFAVWCDAMPYSQGVTAIGYGAHCLFFTVLTIIAVANGYEKIVIPCNLLSTVISFAMTYVVSVGDMNHFFKPLTYHTRVIAPMLVSLFVQGLGMSLYFLTKPSFWKD